MGVRFVDAEIGEAGRISHIILFSLSLLTLAACASAQCGNCDDDNDCTRDWCNATQCQHEPQACDQSRPLERGLQDGGSGRAAIAFAPAYDRGDIDPFMPPLNASFDRGSVFVPELTVNCDDGNPCTRDYRADSTCLHEAISCDDGDSSTIDSCGPSGCINTPAPTLEEDRSLEPMRQSILLELLNESEAREVMPDAVCGDCSDGNVCTTDTCDPIAGCIHAAASCDDSNACTSDSCDPVAGCVHTAMQCDDSDACTTDSCDPVIGCSHEPMACDDGNESTIDSCQGGECIYQPIKDDNRIGENLSQVRLDETMNRSSQNNSTSTAISAGIHHYKCHNPDPCMKLIDPKNCTYQPICDDGNSSTNDYCYGGKCYNTTLPCGVSDNCYIRTFDGKRCIEIFRCRDGDPCTTDSCDGGRCTNKQVVCGHGKVCIDGACRYPYHHYYQYDPFYLNYPYYPYYYPYYPSGIPYLPPTPTPTAAAAAASRPQSYTIPAGTSITLPWGGSMKAGEALQVYNGLAYPAAKPISFTRDLGSTAKTASIGQMALSAMNQWELIGLSWKDEQAGFKMILIQPNKIALPAQGDGQNVVHITGPSYDHYFLRSPAPGTWMVQINSAGAAASGTEYSLISGLVLGPIPPHQAPVSVPLQAGA